MKIYFQALKIILNIGIRNFMSVERKLFPSGKKRKLCFHFVFPSLIRTFDLRSKVLSFGNKKKNEFSFCIPLTYSYL